MLFHFNMKKTYDTVDGRNPANQLRLVVEIPLIIYEVLSPSQVVVWDFSHQQ